MSWYPIDNPNKVLVGNLTPQPFINEVTETFKNVGKTGLGVIFMSVGLNIYISLIYLVVIKGSLKITLLRKINLF